MATSGTTTFNLDLGEILDEAYIRCGKQNVAGEDLRRGRLAVNLLLNEWANRGTNLWTQEMTTIALTATTGAGPYTLPSDTVDAYEFSVRTGSGVNTLDTSIPRYSITDYSNVSNKAAVGRPLAAYVSRNTASTTVTIWMVPPDDSYTLVYWRLRRIQDAGSGSGYTMDTPFRFRPALVAGAAYFVAKQNPQLVSLDLRQT